MVSSNVSAFFEEQNPLTQMKKKLSLTKTFIIVVVTSIRVRFNTQIRVALLSTEVLIWMRSIHQWVLRTDRSTETPEAAGGKFSSFHFQLSISILSLV